jgi:type I restriction enzyme S subunit
MSNNQLESWEDCFLDEVADIIDPHPSHRAPSESRDGIPFPGIGDLAPNGDIDLTSCRMVDFCIYIEHKRRYDLEDGDIGFGRVASIGKVVSLNRDLLPFAVSPTLAIIKPIGIDAAFLRQYLQGPQIAAQIGKLLTGTTRSSLGLELLRKLRINAPAQGEQAKIAEILSTVDQAIEQTEALIAKQVRIKTGLMQDLLTRGITEHGEIRTFAGKQFKDSPLGRVPREWDVGSLLDVSDTKRQPILTGPFGADLGGDDFVEEGIAVLRIGNVQQGYLDLDNLLFVSIEKGAQLKKYMVRAGDLLFARQGATTGRNALASDAADGFLINYHIIRVALDHARCAPGFIEAMFDSDLVKEQIDREKGRGTREGINTSQLKALRLMLPPVDEQRRIDVILRSTTDQCSELKSDVDKMLRLKMALMQDLLTGKRRVTLLLMPNLSC